MYGYCSGSISKAVTGLLFVIVLLGLAMVSGVFDRWLVAIPVESQGFNHYLLPEPYILNDMGVVDLNGDGLLDIFTSNHSARGAIFLNEGGFGFSENMVSKLALYQSKSFPGLAATTEPPVKSAPGLYLYYLKGKLVFERFQLPEPLTASGTLRVPWDKVRTTLDKSSGVFSAEQIRSSDEVDWTQIKFRLERDGNLEIEALPSPSIGIPVQVSLDTGLPAEQIFIGAQRVSPNRHDFELSLQDRHGMAWADIRGDGRADVFISRGGMRGRIKQINPSANDELFEFDGKIYRDTAGSQGIAKNSCPGRKVAWVDYNGDGRLDLYVSCGRPQGTLLSRAANQLYEQQEDGTFRDRAADAGLDIEEAGSFVWFDLDQDNDQDLVWVGVAGPSIYINNKGKFAEHRVESLSTYVDASPKLTGSDFDADGDMDIFVASRKGSYLLKNESNGMKLIDAAKLGLPVHAATADWLDYNNDGRADLHALPGGIYLQDRKGGFSASGILAFGGDKTLRGARLSWADMNNDGRVDLLLAIRRASDRVRLDRLLGREIKSPVWELHLLENVREPGNWLQVSLVGGRYNRQAIGARLLLKNASGQQLQQVGQFEGSHYSQGNYVLNFGLGENCENNNLEIFWPDGSQQDLEGVSCNQRLRIEKRADRM